MSTRNVVKIASALTAAAIMLAAPSGSIVGPAPASADTGERWGFFGKRKPSRDQPYDRSRARQWEAQPPTGSPTISKANIQPINAAIKRYAAIVTRGGWKLLPPVQMRPGTRGQEVRLLRNRLILSGDLDQRGANSGYYDYYVEQAVQRFQMRNGLTPSGMVDRSTLMALNVPASARLQQLRLNLSRMKTFASKKATKFVMVNIPAAQIEAVDQDVVVSRHSAVVGKIDRQTPALNSAIHEINFNPYWHVPQSIIRKDLVPKARQYARRGQDILSIYRIDAYDGKGRKLNPATINWNSSAVYSYAYRQQPWADNSMGFVKINFHNKHSVYLHDTPSKSLFGRNFRAQSSGCVRVQNVGQLVSWLLENNSGWDPGRVQQMKQTGERKDVRLNKKVPVYMVYLTAWATKDGNVHFRRDLYHRDGVGTTASAY